MRISTRTVAAVAAALAAFALLYAHVVVKLVHDWATDGNYSHGFLVVPVALYFVWDRREALRRVVPRPTWIGLAVVVASLGVLLAGVLGAELFLTRISMLGVLAGTILFVAGWEAMKLLAFPIAFLVLMIPIPAIIFNQIAFPLQLLASKSAEVSLGALQIPVLREGNVIMLANTTLEVAEACSGIRSLISLVTLAIIYGCFAERRPWARVALALAAVPVAVVANAARVAGTGVAAHYYGPAAAQGFFHEFSGWLLFLVAFALLGIVQKAIAMTDFSRRPAAQAQGASV